MLRKLIAAVLASHRRQITVCALLSVFVLCGTATAQSYSGKFNSSVIARNLNGPEGIAVHPVTGDIYVAEKEAGRISNISGGSAQPVIQSGSWKVNLPIPRWMASSSVSFADLATNMLTAPGSIAIASNGYMYVTEEVEEGRLLEFVPNENGEYTAANVIGVPWLDRPFTWLDVDVSLDGKLYVAGSVEGVSGLHFGSVLVRELNGEWWVIDYGPFMYFNGVELARSDDVLVVMDRRKGSIAWWDTVRHLPIGEVEQSISEAYAESVGLTYDGAFVVAQQKTGPDDVSQQPARLLRIDPLTAQIETLVDNIGEVGAVELDAEGNLLFIDKSAGAIIRATPDQPYPEQGKYLIKRSLEGYEMGEGFTPRVAPGFLKNFFSKVGVEPIEDQTDQGTQATIRRDVMQFSLKEFASKIPLVAGQIDASSMMSDASSSTTNPLTRIGFVIFFPGSAVNNGQFASPSLGYFNAERKDGSIQKTKQIFQGVTSSKFSRDSDSWETFSQDATLSIPVATCGMEKSDNGMMLNLAFLGLGIYDDYYLRLDTGIENRGEIIVENKNGTREKYRAVFSEVTKSGQPDRDIIVAGFDPLQKSNIGWLNIGEFPVGQAVNTTFDPIHGFSSADEKVIELISEKELEWRMSIPSPDELYKQFQSTLEPDSNAESTNDTAAVTPAEG